VPKSESGTLSTDNLKLFVKPVFLDMSNYTSEQELGANEAESRTGREG
jgi:hypothetical protein